MHPHASTHARTHARLERKGGNAPARTHARRHASTHTRARERANAPARTHARTHARLAREGANARARTHARTHARKQDSHARGRRHPHARTHARIAREGRMHVHWQWGASVQPPPGWTRRQSAPPPHSVLEGVVGHPATSPDGLSHRLLHLNGTAPPPGSFPEAWLAKRSRLLDWAAGDVLPRFAGFPPAYDSRDPDRQLGFGVHLQWVPMSRADPATALGEGIATRGGARR